MTKYLSLSKEGIVEAIIELQTDFQEETEVSDRIIKISEEEDGQDYMGKIYKNGSFVENPNKPKELSEEEIKLQQAVERRKLSMKVEEIIKSEQQAK